MRVNFNWFKSSKIWRQAIGRITNFTDIMNLLRGFPYCFPISLMQICNLYEVSSNLWTNPHMLNLLGIIEESFFTWISVSTINSWTLSVYRKKVCSNTIYLFESSCDSLPEDIPRRGFRIVESVIKTIQNPRRACLDARQGFIDFWSW